jgi:PilZ domain
MVVAGPIKFRGRSADMISMTNRRSELRMMCADMVNVCWNERSGKSRRATALLEDISTSGACLQLEVAVPLGVEIHWKSPRREFKGNVRYCVYREIGYFVGVEFESTSRWSKKTFMPQHFLDPQTLVDK